MQKMGAAINYVIDFYISICPRIFKSNQKTILMKVFKLIFCFSILLLTTTQCTDTQSSNNVDTALVGVWTETTGDPSDDNRRLNISFTSDGRCIWYWSYDSRNNNVPNVALTYWTSSEQIFLTEEPSGAGSDVGDYSITNGELYLSTFDRYYHWNGRTLAK